MNRDLAKILNRSCLKQTSWSVQIRSSQGVVAGFAEDRLLKTASVAKLFLLLEVASQFSSGRLDRHQLLDRDATEFVRDSGVWQYLSAGEIAAVDAAVLVGAASDNLATNALIDAVGLANVQERAISTASGGSQLLDVVRDSRRLEDPWTLSVGCAVDWSEFMRDLRKATLGSKGVCDEVLGWICSSLDLSMVGGAFGLDPLSHDAADRGWRVWNKTGTDQGVRADVGIVESSSGWLSYAAICNWDDNVPARDAVLSGMRDIGFAIRKHLDSSTD